VSHLCTGFAKERKRYFAEIEGEVVKLALAIAGRVLQRESSLDPLLLKGVVHAALAKLGDAKGAVLRMPPEALEEWRSAMRHSGLEFAPDESMDAGDLRLETVGGIAELGIPAQLVEVERGFFDLMARRPA
jgi:flagellar assembly protein FliH